MRGFINAMAKAASITKKKRGRPRNANPTTSVTRTVKGIENETWSKVRAASKKSKQTIGNFVNRTLLDASNEVLGQEPAKREVTLTTDQMLEKLLDSQSELSEKVQALTDKESAGLIKRLLG